MQRVALTGRLAPSPTGRLHVGHARSFLLAWWHARSRDGRVVLRLDDLDASRSRPEFEQGVLEDLEWLGLDWDGPPTRQSEQRESYAEALARLDAAGHVYACVCTRREIESAASAPHADDGTRRYPGTCRERFASPQAAREETGRDPALRFRVPPGLVHFTDALSGRMQDRVERTTGDFPLQGRDGTPAYQLAVIVDDAREGVTEVLRGDDLLPSTARQALLLDALSLPRPTWLHVPLVLDEAARRLAKRTDALSLAALRAEGVDPRALVAWAARSAGQEAPERATPTELLPSFDLQLLPPAPALFGPAQRAALH